VCRCLGSGPVLGGPPLVRHRSEAVDGCRETLRTVERSVSAYAPRDCRRNAVETRLLSDNPRCLDTAAVTVSLAAAPVGREALCLGVAWGPSRESRFTDRGARSRVTTGVTRTLLRADFVRDYRSRSPGLGGGKSRSLRTSACSNRGSGGSEHVDDDAGRSRFGAEFAERLS
jgi:hypothetical protein